MLTGATGQGGAGEVLSGPGRGVEIKRGRLTCDVPLAS